jgi:hypothetical protein
MQKKIKKSNGANDLNIVKLNLDILIQEINNINSIIELIITRTKRKIMSKK